VKGTSAYNNEDVPGDLTRLLERWGDGDRDAVAELMPLVYNELHSLAGSYLRNERPGHTLQCTALVHETYIRLVNMDGVRWQNRAQFFCISAQVVRHILVDHARRRAASKRGGDATVVPLDDALTIPARQDLDVEALDQSLDKLASIDERKAQIVQLRYFAGLSVEEAAEVIGCSPTTVKREWKFAKAWLYRDLHG
jgi:RNA polymerase sigma factor (TIGR02999 family)